jgi:hypothetical protein
LSSRSPARCPLSPASMMGPGLRQWHGTGFPLVLRRGFDEVVPDLVTSGNGRLVTHANWQTDH